jgi:putative ABC transport system ATP-binding protein
MAIEDHVDRHTLAPQAIGQRQGQLRMVLDQQHSHRLSRVSALCQPDQDSRPTVAERLQRYQAATATGVQSSRHYGRQAKGRAMHDQASGAVLLRAHALRKDYGSGEGLIRAVDDVDLQVVRGEALAVRGPSGCGKSTLLHLLGGLDRPTTGELWLGERRIDHLSERALARMRRHEVGFVFQAFHLMDELTAQENVELPALLAGLTPRAARQRAQQLLERVGLSDRAAHLPSALSGGQRQRVAIARALANKPALVLADEPTGNLDSAATLEVLRLFQGLHEEGLTLVVVTHDERIAASADRRVAMRDGAFVGETRLAESTGQDLHPAGLGG